MKVLFVTREYPPFLMGGIGVHTFKLVEHLTKLGVSCDVISFGDERFSTENIQFVNPSSSIIETSGGTLSSNVKVPIDIMRFSRITNTMIKKEKFDIVHVEEPYVGAFINGYDSVKICTFHTTSAGEMSPLVRDFFTRFSLKKMAFYCFQGFYYEAMCIASSSSLIVPTLQIKRELVNVYRTSEYKVKIIRNGVDIPKPSLSVAKAEAKRKLGISPETKLLLSVARIVSRKRLDLLVKATKLLSDKGLSKFHVAIAGTGPERFNLLNLVDKYDLGQIIELPGWISEDKRNLYYQAADIFVLTSDYEGFPFTLLEAMSYGAATVCARINSLDAIRDGVETSFFSPGDHISLANSIEKLLLDSNLCTQLSRASKLFAKDHSWGKTATQTKELYESLL